MNPQYREHIFTEDHVTAQLEGLRAAPLSDEQYRAAHQALVIPTHDAVILYQGGVVLVERSGIPLKGFLWLPGGRIARGVPAERSLTDRVKKECGLDIQELEFAGVERAFMPTDPLGHGKGTDTIGLVYFARGSGELIHDERHSASRIVTPSEYDGLAPNLHPFVRKYVEQAIDRVR